MRHTPAWSRNAPSHTPASGRTPTLLEVPLPLLEEEPVPADEETVPPDEVETPVEEVEAPADEVEAPAAELLVPAWLLDPVPDDVCALLDCVPPDDDEDEDDDEEDEEDDDDDDEEPLGAHATDKAQTIKPEMT